MAGLSKRDFVGLRISGLAKEKKASRETFNLKFVRGGQGQAYNWERGTNGPILVQAKRYTNATGTKKGGFGKAI